MLSGISDHKLATFNDNCSLQLNPALLQWEVTHTQKELKLTEVKHRSPTTTTFYTARSVK